MRNLFILILLALVANISCNLTDFYPPEVNIVEPLSTNDDCAMIDRPIIENSMIEKRTFKDC